MTAPVTDPFAIATERAEGEKVPGVRNLKDRLVVIIPKAPPKSVPNTMGAPGAMQNRLTADVVVCDGGVIMYGGDVKKYVPDTLQMPAPCVIPGMWIFSDVIIDWVLDAVTKGAPIGRIRLQEPARGGNPYWKMEGIPAGHPDRNLALPQFLAYQAGTLFSTADLPKQAPALAQPLAPQFGMQGQVNPAQPTWPAQASTANPFQLPPAPPADWTLAAMPKDFPGSPEQWAGVDQQTRAAFLSQMGITGPDQQPTGL